MKSLYLGLDLPNELIKEEVTHCPIIRVVPLPKEHPTIVKAFKNIDTYTHVIFTSKNTVRFFFDYLSAYKLSLDQLNQKMFLSVGHKTTGLLKDFGITYISTAKNETAEGIVELLHSSDLNNSLIFWPHSALSRPLLSDWLTSKQINFHSCIFYDTLVRKPEPLPDIDDYDEIIFTSPSTVDAFLNIFGKLPRHKKLTCIGPVTKDYLLKSLSRPNF